MRATAILRQAAHRTPLIKFLGKRSVPKNIDSTPHVHPASPTGSLPDSFASYREKASQHGPLSRSSFSTISGGRPAKSFGPVAPPPGQFFDRDELPSRFRRTAWSTAEIEAIESGGASLYA
ncbi:hypothetical protein L228DRAFT_266219 [Xylona heveae TC161]|uniref:Ribosomal protein S36, mitochondrial n=1 Tax=Xylona heveae (strain CBS 132557 / TC161) TaxID=1328760 RepID=A0A165J5Q1_XYLHT|nr:hypothetical protein L228DRAFT_266219 [Xylona heveae TC161]KZF25766.1 hypothetical protein L228DRAFT_266219 [Xylona heveae TC161]